MSDLSYNNSLSASWNCPTVSVDRWFSLYSCPEVMPIFWEISFNCLLRVLILLLHTRLALWAVHIRLQISDGDQLYPLLFLSSILLIFLCHELFHGLQNMGRVVVCSLHCIFMPDVGQLGWFMQFLYSCCHGFLELFIFRPSLGGMSLGFSMLTAWMHSCSFSMGPAVLVCLLMHPEVVACYYPICLWYTCCYHFQMFWRIGSALLAQVPARRKASNLKIDKALVKVVQSMFLLCEFLILLFTL